jgi:hypothetical protein
MSIHGLPPSGGSYVPPPRDKSPLLGGTDPFQDAITDLSYAYCSNLIGQGSKDQILVSLQNHLNREMGPEKGRIQMAINDIKNASTSQLAAAFQKAAGHLGISPWPPQVDIQQKVRHEFTQAYLQYKSDPEHFSREALKDKMMWNLNVAVALGHQQGETAAYSALIADDGQSTDQYFSRAAGLLEIFPWPPS